MANNKLTKKEYTRKRIFAFVAIFLACVLIVTGVAIWLLMGLLSQGASGGVTVSQVAVSPLSFSSFQIDGVEVKDGEMAAGFVFDSQEGDDEGRVSWNGSTSEKMSITVSGVIMNAQHLSSVSYTLELPEGVIEAAKKGYLDISDFYDLETGLVKVVRLSLAEDGKMITDGADTAWRFSFNVTLRWGSLFEGINPSIYYDTLGLHIPIEEVVDTLKDLRETVHGDYGMPVYTLTVTASPND